MNKEAVPTSAGAAKVVLQPHDVILAEIAAALHFNEDQQLGAGILDAMGSSDVDVDRFACQDSDFFVVKRNFGSAGNDEPVLCALRMFLITQSLAGQHFDAFDLEAVTLI